MRRDDALERLGRLLPTLRARYGVKSLAIFGSVARDEAIDSSDIDVLVDFADPTTFTGFMGLKEHLEEVLGIRVDLVTRRALKQFLKPRIEGESIRVA